MINCIVAVDKNQGIGYKNSMPWPFLKEDMNWFKKMTLNNVIIMGSNTWKSLPFRPLKNRVNVVLSRTTNYSGYGAADHTFSDPETALIFCQTEYPDKEIFIIGGDLIYKIYFDKIDTFYVTEIDHEYQCDKFFDLATVKNQFKKVTEYATFFDPVKYTIKEYKL